MNDTTKVKDEATKLHFLDYINFEFDGTMFTFPMDDENLKLLTHELLGSGESFYITDRELPSKFSWLPKFVTADTVSINLLAKQINLTDSKCFEKVQSYLSQKKATSPEELTSILQKLMKRPVNMMKADIDKRFINLKDQLHQHVRHKLNTLLQSGAITKNQADIFSDEELQEDLLFRIQQSTNKELLQLNNLDWIQAIEEMNLNRHQEENIELTSSIKL